MQLCGYLCGKYILFCSVLFCSVSCTPPPLAPTQEHLLPAHHLHCHLFRAPAPCTPPVSLTQSLQHVLPVDLIQRKGLCLTRGLSGLPVSALVRGGTQDHRVQLLHLEWWRFVIDSYYLPLEPRGGKHDNFLWPTLCPTLAMLRHNYVEINHICATTGLRTELAASSVLLVYTCSQPRPCVSRAAVTYAWYRLVARKLRRATTL